MARRLCSEKPQVAVVQAMNKFIAIALGSATVLTRETDGTVIERYSYDAWGQQRSATDWTTAVTSAYESRDYTGHEHLDDIGIIQMNRRV